MSIIKKMFIGYLFIIVIPVIGFGLWLYNSTYHNMADQYARGKQQVLEQFVGNLKVQLSQIESAYEMFQYNANTIDYLNGSYPEESDYVYALLKYIRPIFFHLSIGNPHIKDIVLYSNHSNALVVPPEIAHESDFPFPSLRNRINELPADKGM